MIDRFTARWDEHGFGLWCVDLDGTCIGFTGLAASWLHARRGGRVAAGHPVSGATATPRRRRGRRWRSASASSDLDEIVSFTAVPNHKSRRVMEKLGMVHDPTADFDHPRAAAELRRPRPVPAAVRQLGAPTRRLLIRGFAAGPPRRRPSIGSKHSDGEGVPCRVVDADRPIVLLLHGPNLNLLGDREPEVYGTATLADHVATAERVAAEHGLVVEAFQSNHEGELVDAIHGARRRCAAIIINPGAFTHYAWSLHDALGAFDGPVVELHLSNPNAREPWRHTSVIAPVAAGSIVGFGGFGYELATRAVAQLLASRA